VLPVAASHRASTIWFRHRPAAIPDDVLSTFVFSLGRPDNRLLNMAISRRQFLARASSSLVAGLAVSNGLRPFDANAQAAASAAKENSIPFATPVFLMKYPQKVSDYRCVVNSDASGLIFERTIGSATKLYYLDLTSPSATPLEFAPSLKQSFRPDWSWASQQVTFMNVYGIYTSTGVGDTPILLPNTAEMTYPTWYPDAAHLAVYNNQTLKGAPSPRTSKIDLTGTMLEQVLANDTVWAGFASVNQQNPDLITFAGQVVVKNGAYNQNKNYIWLTNDSATPPTVTTLAPDAPTDHFDPNFQGRAPWYSPDGNWIAFESNRFNSAGLYSIFIQPANGSTPAVRVTKPGWNANHAKWYPNGTELVVTILQKFNGAPNGNRGIAKLDVSAFVS
jgi:hypothetical protein